MNDSNDTTIAAYNLAPEKYIDNVPPLSTGTIKQWLDDNLAALSKDAKILEIGSASGRDAEYMIAKGFQPQLTDAAQSFVDYLQTKGHQVRLLNALADPLGAGYDMVFANAVFLHFTKQELATVLQKAFLALNRDGRLAFSVKRGDGEEITDRKMDNDRYFRYWQPAELKVMVLAAGFGNPECLISEDYRPGRQQWLLITAVKEQAA